MTNETTFQIIFFLAITAFLSIRMYYRLRTKTLQLNFTPSRDSVRMRMFLPLLGILLLGTFAWSINPRLMSWSALTVPEWLRWAGSGIVVVALGLLIWVHHTLSRSFSGNLEIRDQHKLVTRGPYRWVRHPMYSAIFLWAAGLALIAANWFIGMLPLAFGLFFAFRVPTEERMMVEAFGDDYREYMKTTGRFSPRLRF